MKNKTITKFVLFIGIAFFLHSCREPCQEDTKQKKPIKESSSKHEVDTNKVLAVESFKNNVEIIITDPDDVYKTESLQNLRNKNFVNDIFDLVYKEEVEIFDPTTGDPMSLEQVKEIEASDEFDRSLISVIQFDEDWYFNMEEMTFEKKVNSIKLGYAKYDNDSTFRGHKALFGIEMNR